MFHGTFFQIFKSQSYFESECYVLKTKSYFEDTLDKHMPTYIRTYVRTTTRATNFAPRYEGRTQSTGWSQVVGYVRRAGRPARGKRQSKKPNFEREKMTYLCSEEIHAFSSSSLSEVKKKYVKTERYVCVCVFFG